MTQKYKECTENTPLKHEHFRTLLELHLVLHEAICKKAVREKWKTKLRYFYIDLNAGPGVYWETPFGDLKCSPFIFADLVLKRKIEYKAWFVEKNDTIYKELLGNYYGLRELPLIPMNADNYRFTEQFCETDLGEKDRQQLRGMVYADPLGAGFGGSNEFECLELFAKTFPRLDLLIHLQATSIKRCHKVFGSERGHLSLKERIARIKKEKFLIREPYFNNQYSFLLCTNWLQYPNYRRIGFHYTDSSEGAEILDRLNYTAAEREQNGR